MVLYVMILVLAVLIFLAYPSPIPRLVERASANVEAIQETNTRDVT